MSGRSDSDGLDTGVGSDAGRLLVVGVLLLAVTATGVMVLTDNARWLRLGVLAALWSALLGVFLAAKYRKQMTDRDGEVSELQSMYELELEREVAARREYELEVEAEARRRADEESREDLTALRSELRGLRENLERLTGGEVLVERFALRAQSTRMRALADGPGRVVNGDEVRRSIPAGPMAVNGDGPPGRAARPTTVQRPGQPVRRTVVEQGTELIEPADPAGRRDAARRDSARPAPGRPEPNRAQPARSAVAEVAGAGSVSATGLNPVQRPISQPASGEAPGSIGPWEAAARAAGPPPTVHTRPAAPPQQRPVSSPGMRPVPRPASAGAADSGYRNPVPRPASDSGYRDSASRPASDSGYRDPVPRPASDSGYRNPVPRPVSDSGYRDSAPRPASDSGYRSPVPRPAPSDSGYRNSVPRPASNSGYRNPVPRPASESGYRNSVPRPAGTESGYRAGATDSGYRDRGTDSGYRSGGTDSGYRSTDSGYRDAPGQPPARRPTRQTREPTPAMEPTPRNYGLPGSSAPTSGGRRRAPEPEHSWQPQGSGYGNPVDNPAGAHANGKSVTELLAAHANENSPRRHRRRAD